MIDKPSLTLQNDDIRVVVLPEHGADLHSVIHLATGVDVLFKPQWAPSGVSALGGTRATWVADYRGGWQILLPNGGNECVRGGQVWGFHGEASTVPWTVERADPDRVDLSVRLNTVPLRVRRTLTLDGSMLRVGEIVDNTGTDDVAVMYVHHPAFGAPLLGEGARLESGARTVIADPITPGSLVGPGVRGSWPMLPTVRGEVDLREIPGPDQPRMVLAYLTDFADPYFRLTNPEVGLGVEVRWPAEVFPHAWLWQEMCHTPDAPWSGREYVMAVEPATTYPAHGLTTAEQHGGRGIVVAGGGRVAVAIEMTVTPS